MGQYYHPVLMEGCEAIASFSPTHYDNGMKLTEHSWYGNDFVEAVANYAAELRKPVRIAWIGDYADEEDILGNNVPKAMFKAAKHEENEGDLRVEDAHCGSISLLGVAYNLTKGEKLDFAEYWTKIVNLRLADPSFDADRVGNELEFVLHPLPLLTAVGNGKGGGDYHGLCQQMVGRWAFDEILILPKGSPLAPKGEFKDIAEGLTFSEVYR